ncbi:hypothetical protein CCACVL1_08293, partial [Corchorus capsularis]
ELGPLRAKQNLQEHGKAKRKRERRKENKLCPQA